MQNQSKAWDKSSIVALLESSDKAVERALVALFNKQTYDEQSALQTRDANGVGFSAYDAEYFSSLAKVILRGYRLTPKQLAVCRKRGKTGTMRIARYAGQLLKIAAEREQIAPMQAMQSERETPRVIEPVLEPVLELVGDWS